MCYCPLDPDEGLPTVDVVVPQLGEAVSTAVLVAWYVELNERTRKGAPLFEVGTEKTIIEVDAATDGVLSEILVRNGEEVTPGMVVGRITPS